MATTSSELEESKESHNRRRDTRQLTSLLSTFNTHAIDDFIDRGPANGIITNAVLDFYEFFSAHISATAFHIFDEKLKKTIYAFKDAWNACMGYGEFFFYSGLNTFVKFQEPHEVENPSSILEARQNFTDDVAALEKAYSQLMNLVKNDYPEIDLEDTNSTASELLNDAPEPHESDKPELNEKDTREATADHSRRRFPYKPWMLVLAVIALLLTCIFGIPVYVNLFHGGDLCNQTTAPQWMQPILDWYCPEKPGIEEQPLIDSTKEVPGDEPAHVEPETSDTPEEDGIADEPENGGGEEKEILACSDLPFNSGEFLPIPGSSIGKSTLSNLRKVGFWQYSDFRVADFISYTQDGSLLIVGLNDGSVQLIDVLSGTIVDESSEHQARISDLDILDHDDSAVQVFGTSSIDSAARLWVIDDHEIKLLKTIKRDGIAITTISFSPLSYDLVATGDGDNRINLWSIPAQSRSDFRDDDSWTSDEAQETGQPGFNCEVQQRVND